MTGHGHDLAHAAATHSTAHDDDEDDEHAAHAHHGPHIPHESPWVMTVPLVILAVLSTLGGLVGVPYALSSLVGAGDVNVFEHTLEPVVHNLEEQASAAHAGASDSTGGGLAAAGEGHAASAPSAAAHSGAAPESVGEGRLGEPTHERAHDPSEVGMERLFTLISVIIAVVGIGIGWMFFRRRPLAEMPRVLENKYYVDEAYNAGLINPIKAGSREGLWRFFDVNVIDGIVNGIGRGMSQLASVARYLQPGFVRSYAAIILLGALAVVGFFAYNAYQMLR